MVLKKKTIEEPNAVKPHVKSVAKSANKTGLNSRSFSIFNGIFSSHNRLDW
jgi:hypothetical protein